MNLMDCIFGRGHTVLAMKPLIDLRVALRMARLGSCCGLLSGLLLICGCDGRDGLTKDSVNGNYEGNQGSMREVIVLTPDGNFRHEVYRGASSLVEESGAYAIDGNMITLQSNFTSFHDERVGNLGETGRVFGSWTLWATRVGSSSSDIRLSHWPDDHYRLCKTNDVLYASSTNSQANSGERLLD